MVILRCSELQASKTISSGEGGIIVTNNKKLWNKAKLASNLGYKSS